MSTVRFRKAINRNATFLKDSHTITLKTQANIVNSITNKYVLQYFYTQKHTIRK